MHSIAPCLCSTLGSICFSVGDYSCAHFACGHCDIVVEKSTVRALNCCTLTFLQSVKSQLASPGPLLNAAPTILLPGEEGPGARLMAEGWAAEVAGAMADASNQKQPVHSTKHTQTFSLVQCSYGHSTTMQSWQNFSSPLQQKNLRLVNIADFGQLEYN